MIVLSGNVTASNTDILQGTRLQTVPANGYLIFEIGASSADTTNYYTVSIQMPNGDTPLTDVLVPTNEGTTIGVLDKRTQLRVVVPVRQGGHAVFSCTETGAGTMTYRVTYASRVR